MDSVTRRRRLKAMVTTDTRRRKDQRRVAGTDSKRTEEKLNLISIPILIHITIIFMIMLQVISFPFNTPYFVSALLPFRVSLCTYFFPTLRLHFCLPSSFSSFINFNSYSCPHTRHPLFMTILLLAIAISC